MMLCGFICMSVPQNSQAIHPSQSSSAVSDLEATQKLQYFLFL